MNIIAQILALANFESSSGKTPEFMGFVAKFKKAFKAELKTIGVTDITFSVGHFYISGFFVKNEQTYYFSISDVRSPVTELLYRTAKHNKDFTGGANQWVKIGEGMAQAMRLN